MFNIGLVADTETANAEVSQPTKACSKCKSVLDTTGYPLWCSTCRNHAQNENYKLRKKLARSAGFAAGAEAMRKFLADEFEKRYPPSQILRFNGHEIAYTIRGLPAPTPPEAQ